MGRSAITQTRPTKIRAKKNAGFILIPLVTTSNKKRGVNKDWEGEDW